jgi:hypothetical protein
MDSRFYEKALFVKADVAASPVPDRQQCPGPRFYSHSSRAPRLGAGACWCPLNRS